MLSKRSIIFGKKSVSIYCLKCNWHSHSMNCNSVNRSNFWIACVLYSLPPPPPLQDQREREGERATDSGGGRGRGDGRGASELWRRHIPSGRIEATFADFGAGILRQTATKFKVGLQTVVRPRPDLVDSGPQGRPGAGF